MLKLCAAQLRQHYPVKGAGDTPASLAEFILKQRANTGLKGGSRSPLAYPQPASSAVPELKFYPVSNFDLVYLVDITPSLCEVARQRFKRLGWDNVRVLCMDAAKFQVPKEDGGPDGVEFALVTLSYSRGLGARASFD